MELALLNHEVSGLYQRGLLVFEEEGEEMLERELVLSHGRNVETG